MARPLRIQYAGAIYHLMTRGNGLQLLCHEQDDYQRMLDGLAKTVDRTGWEVFGIRLDAYLAHRRTTTTLRELGEFFGLRHPDSASNLIRRAEKALAKSTKLKLTAAEIEQAIEQAIEQSENGK